MAFTIYDADGNAYAGDRRLDDALKAMADEIGGTIKDDRTGELVYPVF